MLQLIKPDMIHVISSYIQVYPSVDHANVDNALIAAIALLTSNQGGNYELSLSKAAVERPGQLRPWNPGDEWRWSVS